MTPTDSRRLPSEALRDAARVALKSRTSERPVKTTKARLRDREDDLKRIRASPSWRITRPLRTLNTKLRATPRTAASQSRGADAIDRAEAAMHQRISAALQQLGATESSASIPDDPLTTLARYLAAAEPRTDELWLIYLAVAARFPTTEELESLVAAHQIGGPEVVMEYLLAALTRGETTWAVFADLAFVRDVVVDVSRSATSTTHSGIQRVVREVIPRWAAKNSLALAVFDHDAGCYRFPSQSESASVLEWEATSNRPVAPPVTARTQILVPWQTVIVVPEFVGPSIHAPALVCISDSGSSSVASICYDLIPYLLPEHCSDLTRQSFVETFSVIRSSARVSAISKSVGTDFERVALTFPSVGVKPPAVLAQPLPTEPFASDPDSPRFCSDFDRVAPELPLVVAVGTFESRKNQLRILLAAEALWRSGVEFELLLIGWSRSARYPVRREVTRLAGLGHPVSIARKVSDGYLRDAYTAARFTVFISRAEGYGLPIAESLIYGTPVITSNFGAMAEIGEGGGTLQIDPMQQPEVSEAMRTLLTRDDVLARLEAEASLRSFSTWDAYADSAWRWLVEGVEVP